MHLQYPMVLAKLILRSLVIFLYLSMILSKCVINNWNSLLGWSGADIMQMLICLKLILTVFGINLKFDSSVNSQQNDLVL